MDVSQTINITIDNTDKQEQKQKQDASTDDSKGNSGNDKVGITDSTVKPVKLVK